MHERPGRAGRVAHRKEWKLVILSLAESGSVATGAARSGFPSQLAQGAGGGVVVVDVVGRVCRGARAY